MEELVRAAGFADVTSRLGFVSKVVSGIGK
jgi:hypothetical protein